jgi:hypothetical protein
MPLCVLRVRKLWQSAGGWAQAYGKRRAVGVKPPRLVQLGDKSIGDRVFVRVDDVREKVQHNTCHELVHAFTAHLKLPAWLNEGLAMVTVDRYVGRPTVRCETLEALERRCQETDVERKRKMRVGDEGWVAYHYVRGYWLTRYLEETRPGLLKGLLSRHHGHRELESKIAAAYGMEPEEFWEDIDGVLISRVTSSTF